MFSFALLTEQFKRFGPMMILSIIVYLLFVILPIYNTNNPYQAAVAMVAVLSMRNPIMLAATIIIPFATVVMLFSSIYDNKMSIGLIGLADNKNQLFWTNVAVAFIMMLVPIILSCLVLLVRVDYPGQVPFIPAAFPHDVLLGERLNSLLAVIAFGIRLVLSFSFYFSVFLLAFSLSGNRLIAGILSIVLPLIPVMIYRAGMLISVLYVFGFDSQNAPMPNEIAAYANPIAWFWETASSVFAYIFDNSIIVAAPVNPANVLRLTNPIMWYWNWGEERQLTHLLIYSAFTLVIFAVAYFCFLTRKAERVGEGIVFKPLKHVLLFLASATGMIAIGGFLLDMASGRWFVYYGLILGFILSFCITQMIFERNFNIFSRIRLIIPHAIAMLFVYGTIHFISIIVLTSYVDFVPNQEEVSGVFVSRDTRWEEDIPFANDSESIRQGREMHTQIIGRHYTWQLRMRHVQQMQAVRWQSVVGEGRLFTEQGGEYLFLTYQLINGDIIFRRYAIPGEEVRPQARAVARTEQPEDEDIDMPASADATPLPSLPIEDFPHAIEYIRLRFLDMPGPGGAPLEFVVLDPQRIGILTTIVQRDLIMDQLMGAGSDYQLEVYFQVSDAYRHIFGSASLFLVQSDNVFAFMLEYYSEMEETSL